MDTSIDEAHLVNLVQLVEDGPTGHSMYNTVKPMLCNMGHDDVPAGLSRLQYIADRPGEKPDVPTEVPVHGCMGQSNGLDECKKVAL